MNLLSKLKYTLTIFGIFLFVPAHAGDDDFVFLFGESNFNTTNGLNITTTSGNYFVPITNSGWWNRGNNIIHKESIKNYFASTYIDSSLKGSNNFFTFDLSDISETIISASLRLFTYGMSGTSVEYKLFDITSPLSDVRATGTSALVYNDLMSGVS